ncbi:nitric oxide synthase-interacting protein [Biomphalaria glabrata]|nr:nitric oxide synthase-interacting protein [Biomphalaria glabrata]
MMFLYWVFSTADNKLSEEKTKSVGLSDDKKLPSFWIPALTPQAEATQIKKPDDKVRCPMSGKTIKFKDLIPVKFTPINDRDEKTSLIAKTNRYVCAVTNDILGNSVPCAVLRPSGAVVTLECVEKIIKKDMMDPISGQKLKDKDIITLQRGASGFTGAGVTLEAKKAGPSIMA